MVDASCGGTFMLKNEHEAWQLFETLSKNSLHHMSAACRDPPIGPKRGGIYEVGHSIDIYSKVDELSQKLDRLLQSGKPSPHLIKIMIFVLSIRGRPFLATTNACINCRTGVMDVSFGNKKVRLNVFNATLGPPTNDYGEVNILETLVEEAEPVVLTQDPL